MTNFFFYPTKLASVFIFSFCCLSTSFSFSQNGIKKNKATGDLKVADENFRNGNFIGALGEYLVLLSKDQNNEKYNYRIGICYLNTDIEKAKALSYCPHALL